MFLRFKIPLKTVSLIATTISTFLYSITSFTKFISFAILTKSIPSLIALPLSLLKNILFISKLLSKLINPLYMNLLKSNFSFEITIILFSSLYFFNFFPFLFLSAYPLLLILSNLSCFYFFNF